MKQNISVDILERYIENKCTPQEEKFVQDWYQSLDSEDDYVSGLNKREEKILENKIYQSILNNIQPRVPVKNLSIANNYRKIIYTVTGIAAMLLIGITVVLYEKDTNSTKPAINKSKFLVVENNSKRIYKTTFPDGSHAWLSPNAKITYPAIFDAKFRLISLSGESFFEITKNPIRPFIIKSKGIITKVWGTSFRIRDKAASSEVSVVTGKVSVSVDKGLNDYGYKLGKQDLLLYPDQKAVFLYHGKKLKKVQETDKASLRLWNKVNLSFENVKLSEIISILNSKFDVHLVVTDSKFNSYVLSADFTDFNLPDVLQALQKTLGLRYEINSESIELK